MAAKLFNFSFLKCLLDVSFLLDSSLPLTLYIFLMNIKKTMVSFQVSCLLRALGLIYFPVQ